MNVELQNREQSYNEEVSTLKDIMQQLSANKTKLAQCNHDLNQHNYLLQQKIDDVQTKHKELQTSNHVVQQIKLLTTMNDYLRLYRQWYDFKEEIQQYYEELTQLYQNSDNSWIRKRKLLKVLLKSRELNNKCDSLLSTRNQMMNELQQLKTVMHDNNKEPIINSKHIQNELISKIELQLLLYNQQIVTQLTYHLFTHNNCNNSNNKDNNTTLERQCHALYNVFFQTAQTMDELSANMEEIVDKIWDIFESKWNEWTPFEIMLFIRYHRDNGKLIETDHIWETVAQKFAILPLEARQIELCNNWNYIDNWYLSEVSTDHNFKRKVIEWLQCVMMTYTKQIPNEFLCSLTQEIMTNPVIAYDGKTYEKSAILEYMNKNHNTPSDVWDDNVGMTIMPNRKLKKAIQQTIKL